MSVFACETMKNGSVFADVPFITLAIALFLLISFYMCYAYQKYHLLR